MLNFIVVWAKIAFTVAGIFAGIVAFGAILFWSAMLLINWLGLWGVPVFVITVGFFAAAHEVA